MQEQTGDGLYGWPMDTTKSHKAAKLPADHMKRLVSYIVPTLRDDDKEHEALGIQYWRFILQDDDDDDESQIYKTLYKEYQRSAKWIAMKIVKV